MSTRIACGWDGEYVWFRVHDFDRDVTETFLTAIPRRSRYWEPSSECWRVLPGYVEQLWDALRRRNFVDMWWEAGPKDAARLASTGAPSMWEAFPPGGIYKPPPGADTVPNRPGYVYADSLESGTGWPRIYVTGETADVPDGWRPAGCLVCGTTFLISDAELSAVGRDGAQHCRQACRAVVPSAASAQRSPWG